MLFRESVGRLFAVGPWVHSGRREHVTYLVSCFTPLNPNKNFNVAQRRVVSLITRHAAL